MSNNIDSILVETVNNAIKSVFNDITYRKELNERYIHHYLSYILQKNNLFTIKPNAPTNLHPEWPTYKEKTKIDFGKYRKEDGKYIINDNGKKGGFIDFCVGEYNNPIIAIEITLKYSWEKEEIIYDFMKLLDNKNKTFKYSYSLNFLMRENPLVDVKTKSYMDFISISLPEVFNEAKSRLGESRIDYDRKMHFIICELSKFNDERRYFYLNDINKCQWDEVKTIDEII